MNSNRRNSRVRAILRFPLVLLALAFFGLFVYPVGRFFDWLFEEESPISSYGEFMREIWRER